MADLKQLVKSTVRRAVPSQARSTAQKALRQAGLLGQQANEPYQLWRSRLAEEVSLQTDVGIAVVGCGLQARNVAGALVGVGGRVRDALDLRPGVAAKFLADHGNDGEPSDGLDALLDGPRQWSVLVISSTAGSHVSIATQAIEAGVDRILIEKPVATSVADGRQLGRLAAEHGAAVAVNHTRRWLPSSRGVARLAGSGVIGPIESLHFLWGRNGFAMIGTHLFDFARLITGAEFASVRCELDAERRVTWRGDQFIDQPGFATATMTDGTRVVVDLSSDLATQQGFLVIAGPHGRLEVDEMLGRVRMVGSGRRVWDTEYAFGDALALGSARAIVDLHEGREPACTIDDAVAALEMAVACQISSRTGAAVPLPLDDAAAREEFPFA